MPAGGRPIQILGRISEGIEIARVRLKTPLCLGAPPDRPLNGLGVVVGAESEKSSGVTGGMQPPAKAYF